VNLTRRNIRIAATVVIAVGLVVAGFVIFRRMSFSFLSNLGARSLMYIVPLFLVYETGGILSYALLLRDMGHRVGVVRLTVGLFADYSSNLTGAPGTGTPMRARGLPVSAGTSAAALLYSVEFGISVLIALTGLNYFVPETTFRNVAWVAVAAVVIVALSVVFHVSRRKESRLPRVGRRLSDFLADVRDGMRKTTASTLAVVVGLALAKRVVLAATSYLILNEIGSPLGFRGIIFLQSAAILVGFVSMVPLGLGTKDIATFLLYMRLGMPPEVSMAMAVLERAIWTLVPFCLGLVCALLTGARPRDRR
jgi:uncharacterized protein (TIRG00374 family)